MLFLLIMKRHSGRQINKGSFEEYFSDASLGISVIALARETGFWPRTLQMLFLVKCFTNEALSLLILLEENTLYD